MLFPQEGVGINGELLKMSVRFTELGELALRWRSYVREATGFQQIAPTHAYEHGRPFRFDGAATVAIPSPHNASDYYRFFEPRLKTLCLFQIGLATFGPSYGYRESDIKPFQASARRVQAFRPRIIVSSHCSWSVTELTSVLRPIWISCHAAKTKY